MTNRRAPERLTTGRRAVRRSSCPSRRAMVIVATTVPATGVEAHGESSDLDERRPDPLAPDAELQPTIQYEEALAHARDRITFAPGDRVKVAFSPRRSDRWQVGGVAPRSLPAGRMTGKAIREARTADRESVGPQDHGRRPARRAAGRGPPGAGAPIGAVDMPTVDPPPASMGTSLPRSIPGGLRREVFGFLPYWELTDTSTRLDWETLSTIAYFGVGAAANGNLERTNSDGSTTVGWSGWTSSKLTSVINAAHAHGTRVVLTVQSFAWTSSQVVRQKALLGSPAARAKLARQIAAAVRDRGADGVNLDFEPIVSGYADEFTLLTKSIRAELNRERGDTS